MLRLALLPLVGASLVTHVKPLLKQADNGVNGTVVDDVLKYVDPLIGSQAGGNVFAGASLPFGMAKGEFQFQFFMFCFLFIS
jgi:hypothetical protein